MPICIFSLYDINLKNVCLSSEDELPVLNHCNYNEECKLTALDQLERANLR